MSHEVAPYRTPDAQAAVYPVVESNPHNPERQQINAVYESLSAVPAYEASFLQEEGDAITLRPGSLMDPGKRVYPHAHTQAVIRTGVENPTSPDQVENWLVMKSLNLKDRTVATYIARAADTLDSLPQPVAQITDTPVVVGKHPRFGNLRPGEQPRQDVSVALDAEGQVRIESLTTAGVEVVAQKGTTDSPDARRIAFARIVQEGKGSASTYLHNPVSNQTPTYGRPDVDKVEAILTEPPQKF